MSSLPVIVKTNPTMDGQRLNLTVHVSADVLTPEAARRRANGWLLDHVGNLLLAETPELVVGDQIVWRVPIVLTSPTRGHIGSVGAIDLDAISGEVISDSTTIEQIHARAKQLTQG
jgi:hypothetical protein